MAKDEKRKEPDALELLKQNYSKVKKITASTLSAHSEAYITAQNKHLKEGKYINHELLEKADVQKKFLDTMIDHYLEKAVSELNLKEKPKDAMEQDRILKAYANVTRGELDRQIKTQGKDYTLGHHEQIRDKLMEKVTQELIASASGHIGQEHTGALVKAMGLDDIVDVTKMQHTDALALYNMYDQKGDLSAGDIKSQYKRQGMPSPIYLKTPKKDEKKSGKVVPMDSYSKSKAA